MRKVLGTIYGPVCIGGVWRRRYNHGLYQLYGRPDIVAMEKSNRLGRKCVENGREPTSKTHFECELLQWQEEREST